MSALRITHTKKLRNHSKDCTDTGHWQTTHNASSYKKDSLPRIAMLYHSARLSGRATVPEILPGAHVWTVISPAIVVSPGMDEHWGKTCLTNHDGLAVITETRTNLTAEVHRVQIRCACYGSPHTPPCYVCCIPLNVRLYHRFEREVELQCLAKCANIRDFSTSWLLELC